MRIDSGNASPDLPIGARAWQRRVWSLSWPVILSNATVPLVGVVDTAVVGHLADPAYIGAVAIGALIFTFFAWVFGFLRMGTTGFVAQAWGAYDLNELSATVIRALGLAVAISICLILMQQPLQRIVFGFLGGSRDVEALAALYYRIRIWGAPAAMIHLVVLGLLFGIQRMRLAFFIQIVLNGTNIGLDFLFVRGLGWGVSGVAGATLISETSAALLGLYLAYRCLNRLGCRWRQPTLFHRQRLQALFAVNSNLTVRTLCVQGTLFYFTSVGAQLGDVTLAANAILLHFVHVMTFALDGFAHAAEALAGQAFGARNRQALRAAMSSTMRCAAVVALAFSLFYLATGSTLIGWMSALHSVRSTANLYLPWIVLAPLISVWAYQLDGIYLGTTRTTEMRNGMLIAFAIYLLCVWLSLPRLGNHGLWLSMMVFMLARSATLGLWYRNLERQVDVLQTR